MAFSEKDIARRRTELQHAPNSDRFKYQKPDVSAPVNYGSSAPSSQKRNGNTSGSSTKVTGNYTEEAIARRRKELQHGGGDRFAYKGPDFSVLPAPKFNPFNHVNYTDPVTQKFHQQTGWRDPGTQALYELVERTRNPQRKITPASTFQSGPIAGSDIGPRSRSFEAANRAAEAEKEAAEQAAAGIQFDRFEAVKRRQSNIIPPETIESNTERQPERLMRPSYVVKNPDGTLGIHTPTAEDIRPWESHQEDPIASIVSGVVKGTGAASLGLGITGALANATGNEELQEKVRQETLNEMIRSQQDRERHPIAYGAGNIAGNLALMSGIGKVIGVGAGAIKTASTAGRAALRMGASALNFAATNAIQEAGAASVGIITPEEYVKNIAVSGGSGLASSVASMALAGGIEKILLKTGNQTAFLDFVKNLTAASAGSAARIGVEHSFEDKTPTDAFRSTYLASHSDATEEDVRKAYESALRQQAAIQFGTAFCFNLFSSYMDTLRTNKAMEAYLKNEFDKLERDVEPLGNMRIQEDEVGTWKQMVNERTSKLRSVLSENYFAGQQDKVDGMMALLDEIDDRAAQAYSNVMGATTENASTPPSPEFVDAVGIAMQQGVAEAAQNPPAVINPDEPIQAPAAQEPARSTTDMLSEIANTPMPAEEEPIAPPAVNTNVDNINAGVDKSAPTTETTAPTTEEVAPVEEKTPQEIVQQEEKPAERTTTDMLQEIANTEYETPAAEEAPAVEQPRAEEIQAPAVEEQKEPEPPAPVSESPAPLNEAPAEGKIESGNTFKVKDGDVQVAARRIFREGKQRGGVPTASLIGEDGRQYFTDGTMAVVLNNKVEGIGVQGETGTWKNEDAARYIKVMDQAIEDSREQKDILSVDYPSFHTAIKSLSKAKMTEYEGMKLFSFDGKKYFDFGPSAQLVNAEKLETALRMLENPEIHYTAQHTNPRTPIYIKGDNGNAVIFPSNSQKIKRFLYGDLQNQETQKPASKAPEAPKPAVTKKEFATEEASKLSADLFRRKRVDQNGLRYTIRGDDGEFFGSIERIGEGHVKNARDTIYNVGPKATLQEVADDLAAVAENNHFLEEADNGENTQGLHDKSGVLQPDISGAGAGGLSGGVLSEDVPGNEERGNVTPDASGDRRADVPAVRPTSGSGVHGRSGDGSGAGDQVPVQTGERDVTESNSIEPKTPAEKAKQTDDIVSQPEPKGTDFRIPEKGWKLPTKENDRFNANVEAINVLHSIIADGRIATPAEQEVLARFTGWGGISDQKWRGSEETLHSIMTDAEFRAASRSLLDAYYTDPDIIRGMYKGLEKLGFTGGRMLEPSSGVGRFIGALPDNLRPGVKSWTAVELDNITGNIAKYLYPNADVRVQGFEKAKIAGNYMDLVIGNVPFGNVGIYDKAYPNAVTSRIHNYFIAKSLDAARPGGIVCVITSAGTMNSQGTEAREYFASKADLIGAIRLPNNAFEGVGTGVVSDILVFKKRAENTPYKGESFVTTEYSPYKYGEEAGFGNNVYFEKHPEMVLGTYDQRASHFGPKMTVNPLNTKASLGEQIEKAFSNIKAKMDYPTVNYQEENQKAIREASNRKEGTAYKRDGKLYKNDGGKEVQIDIEEKNLEKYSAVVDIRDAARELIEAMKLGRPMSEISAARKKLNNVYDDFAKKFGTSKNPASINSLKNLLKNDSDYAFLRSLEKVDGKKVTKADLFYRDTITPNVEISSVDSIADGIQVSVNETGHVDVARIASLMRTSEADVEKAFIRDNLAYKDKFGNYIDSETYLSGNVVAKLKDAEALAESDPSYKRNVDALKKVVPKKVAGEEIRIRMGATWIPPQYYGQFLTEILGGKQDYITGRDGITKSSVTVEYSPAIGYTVNCDDWRLISKAENNSIWGTKRMALLGDKGLAYSILNNKTLAVYDTDSDGKRIFNKTDTEALNDLKEKINQEFNNWLWKDPERRNSLETVYNDAFNNMVRPKYTGEGLTIAGQASDIKLRDHQSAAIVRIVKSPYNTLLQHGAGAGKTYAMIGAGIKMKQLGLCKKPVYVVPKNKVGDWERDFHKMFPGAKVLVADEKTFAKENRKAFSNTIAITDADAVVISHEQFKMIPMSAEYQQQFYQDQVDTISAALEAAKRKSGSRFTVRQLESAKKSIETKLQKLSETKRDENNINFEDVGIDYLFVDEAQKYKNLFYFTNRSKVADMGSPNGNQTTFDMMMKANYIRSINAGKGIVFGTATPIMNSPVEAYNMLRYLAEEELEKRGIHGLDDFINDFGRIEETVTKDPAGAKFVTKNAFLGFTNMPEWGQIWGITADIIKTEDVPGIVLPKLKNGERTIIKCQPGPLAEQTIRGLGDRLKTATGKKGEDHIFKIQSDGKKASFSQRMIDPSLPYGEQEKVPVAAQKIYEIWENSKTFKDRNGNVQQNGTQLVFCDLGVPKADDTSTKKVVVSETDAEEENPNTEIYDSRINVYKDLKDMLIAKGVPAEEIAFIHDASNDKKREELYQKVRSGKVRVLIGSSMKMGEGLNVQDRIVAMHELNPLRRPGDVEQAEARGIRQGNMSPEVEILVYVTERSFDEKQWEVLRRKAGFIEQAEKGDITSRDVDFGSGEFGESAGEIMAIASGNPLLKEQADVNHQLDQLENLYIAHNRKVADARNDLARAERSVSKYTELVTKYEADLKVRKDIKGDKFNALVGNVKFTKQKEFGDAIVEAAKKVYTADKANTKIGNIAGFDIYASGTYEKVSLVGHASYDLNINYDSGAGSAQRIVNTVYGIENLIAQTKDSIHTLEANIPKYREIINSKFEKEAELIKTRARATDIQNQLLNMESAQTVESESKPEKAPTIRKLNVSAPETESAHKAKWEAKRVGDTDKAPMSTDDIIRKIRHDLGLSITTGHIRGKGVMGQYNTHDQGIRTKIANDLPSLAHEVGHHFDQKYDVITDDLSREVKKELDAALRKDPEFNASKYKKSDLPHEGFAEYIRQYMQNREEAAISYPELTAHFKSKLSARELAQINSIADEINAYYSLDADNAQSSLRLREEGGRDFRTIREKIRDMGEDLYQTWIDSNHSIKRFDDAMGGHAYKLASNAAYSDAVAGQLIVGDLTDVNGRYVGPGLKEALHGIDLTDRPTYIAFNEYLVCRHGQTWLEDGKRIFADDRKNSTAFMQRRVEELEAQHENFKEAADRLVDFVQRFTQTWGVDTGLISQETLDKWNEKYPDYVPMYRMMEKGTPGAKRGFANQNSPYKRAKGSGLDIMAPVDGVIDQIVRVTNTALRNNVMLEMRRAYQKSPDADANFISPVPTPLRPKKFDMTGMKAQLAGDISDAMLSGNIKMSADSAKELGSIIDSINDVMLQFERGRAKDNVVTILVNGKKEYWQVNDKKLLESIGNMNPAKIGGLLEAYAKTTRFLTANITGNNPIWSIFSNAPRDLGTFLVYSKSNKDKLSQISNIGIGWINSVNANLRGGKNVDPLYLEYLAMGGGWTSAYSADADLAKNVWKKLTSNKAARTMDTMNPLNWVSFMADTIEQGPRFATYKLLRESGLSPQEAFYEAMDVTVNFRKAGAMSRQVNKVVPFFNAGLQGADKFARYFSAEDIVGPARGKAAAGRFGAWAAASMILAALTYALNGRDEEKRKEYSQLSNYTKNNFWCIPLGNGQYFAIPKPRELAVMTSFAESAMDFTVGKNEHAFDEYYDYATDVFLPGIVSDLAQLPVHAVRDGLDPAVTEFSDRAIGSLGIIGAFHDLSANRDFLGRSIVSKSLESYEPKDQFTRATSKVAYWIGRGLNYSPQKIDYLGNQVLGYWWKIQKALFPVGEEYVDRSLGVKNTYFKDNVYSQDLVNWIYDSAEKSARKYKSSQDPKDGIRAKNDDNMKKFYANFYRISKDLRDRSGPFSERQLVLDMINDYRSFTDHEILTPVQEAVYGVVERTNNMELLPGVMKTEIKTGETSVELAPITYVQYQTGYNETYWKYIEDNLDVKASDSQQASVISAAKKIAQAKAAKRAALFMGVTDYDVEDSKAEQWVDDGGDLSVWTDFEAARKEGKQDGAAEWLNNSSLSDEEKWALWELAGWSEKTFDKKVN